VRLGGVQERVLHHGHRGVRDLQLHLQRQQPLQRRQQHQERQRFGHVAVGRRFRFRSLIIISLRKGLK